MSGAAVPDVVWVATQAVPSPELASFDHATRFGLRWQVTPLLYSFGTHRSARRWRAFIAEPFTRHVGSVELFASPEYMAADRAEDRASLRVGTRSYFPIASRGEYLSVSLGASYSTLRGGGVGYEAGAYTLFGVIGFALTYSPSKEAATWIGTLRFRYF